MASIVQYPDSLSFLRNLKRFIINSSEDISFELKNGAAPILTETYSPDSFDQIEIDVSEAIGHYLYTSLPTSDVYVQKHATAEFSAYINNEFIAKFKVVNGGVSSDASASSFLGANWLTWQPQVKQVSWDSPEYLSYYFASSSSVKCKFYLQNGGTETISIGTGTAGKVCSFRVTLSYLFGKSSHALSELSGYVDLWVGGSYTQRLVCMEAPSQIQTYLAVNSLGGIDTFEFRGAKSQTSRGDREIVEKSGDNVDISDTPRASWSQDSGLMGKSMSAWVWELLASRTQWAVSGDRLIRIVIDNDSVNLSTDNALNSFTFDYSPSSAKDSINIRRTAGDIQRVKFPSPSGEIFFLEARLIDLPDAKLTDDILFLVQSPFSTSWSKTSLASIKSWIGGIISSSEIGIHAHSHENKNVLDAISEVDGQLQYKGKKLAAAEEFEKKFLKKNEEDSATARIAFLNGLTAGEFIPGPNGQGAYVDKNGEAEMHSLVLRTFLEAPEFRFNRVSVEVGNKWNAPGGGLIESVVPDLDASGYPLMTGTAYLHLEEGEFGKIAVDDICQGIFHDGVDVKNNSDQDSDDGAGNFSFSGFFTSYFRIIEILDAKSSSFKYQLRGVSENWQSLHHPCQAMTFVCYGNFNDAGRQISRYSTRSYERYLRGVNTWEFSFQNVAAQFGDLSNLSAFGQDMKGYSAYLDNVYLSGYIQQVEKAPLRLEYTSVGDTALVLEGSVTLKFKAMRGWNDMTDKVISWSIARDSGFPQADKAWGRKQKAANFKGDITLVFSESADVDDLGQSAGSTLFTVTAKIGGEKPEEASFTIYIRKNLSGQAGISITDVDVEFALSTSRTIAPVSGWQTDAPAWKKGYYYWQRTKVTYSSGDPTYTGVACVSGEDGRGVTSVKEQYYLSSSDSSLIGGSWLDACPARKKGWYIWTRTVYTYTSGDPTTTDPKCTTGDQGDKGEDGRSITGADVEFALSTSRTIAPVSGWQTDAPAWKKGYYYWQRTKVTYSSGDPTYTGVACISGEDGRGIVSVKEQYYLSSSSSALIGGSWEDTCPTRKKGWYIWTRTVITYTSGDPTTTDPQCTTGDQGDKGEDGRSITGADVEYALSTSRTEAPVSGWQTTAPAWKEGHYYWQRTMVTYSTGSPTYTGVACVSGEDGRGVTSVKEQYYLSSSDSSLIGGSWLDACPTRKKGWYIWTRTVITYTSGDPTTTDPQCTTGDKGDKGDPGVGKKGAALRGPQDWEDCEIGFVFEAGQEDERWLDVVRYNGQTFECIKRHSKTTSNYPGSSAGAEFWKAGMDINLVAAKLILAEGANIANWIFQNQRLESQSGTGTPGEADWVPNVYLDGKNGEASFAGGNVLFSGLFARIGWLQVLGRDLIGYTQDEKIGLRITPDALPDPSAFRTETELYAQDCSPNGEILEQGDVLFVQELSQEITPEGQTIRDTIMTCHAWIDVPDDNTDITFTASYNAVDITDGITVGVMGFTGGTTREDRQPTYTRFFRDYTGKLPKGRQDIEIRLIVRPYGEWRGNAYLSIDHFQAITLDRQTFIGKDGIICAFNGDYMMYKSNDGFHVKVGDHGLDVTSAGVSKY